MVERSERFPHIQLKLTTQGIAASPPGGGRKQNPQTSANLSDRWGHGSKLKSSVDSLVSYWQDTQEKREEEGKPLNSEKSIPIILQIDPTAFDAEDLRKYGIELIAELENGYIVGASANETEEFSELQKKIEKFIKEERGGNKVAGIWEILDGTRRPEYILSPELLNQWDQIGDEQIYIVDVGVACVGTKSQLPECPERKEGESDEKYAKRINNWIDKRDATYQQWDALKSQREDELTDFVTSPPYQGEILNIVDGIIPKSSELSDSFSCRIQISGQGLKDLVLSFPYIFDVSEPDEFAEILQREGLRDTVSPPPFQLESPESNAPKVCVIDSGIQERHSLLKAAIDSGNSRSWIPGKTQQTADYVSNGGHGTRVAGAVIYPRTIPRSGTKKAVCWIQNARVLDDKCQLPKQLFPPNLLSEVVELYHEQTGTKLFNHSITGDVPCRTQYMSAWAAAIDNLTWQKDILFIVASGNLPLNRPLNEKKGFTRLSVQEHLAANRTYPDYLLADSCRIANPAQSFQSLTVGSISSVSYNVPPCYSISEKDKPSAFSRSGLGIWETIKPEVVEYGGDLVKDEGTPPNITYPKNVCPELVRSTLNGGSAVASDTIGTSFAAPKVSHIAACIAADLPDENCLLYRALIVQSARWSESAKAKLETVRLMGYGIPNLERALGNAPNRITLITRGERLIKARQAHVYQVKLPEELRTQGEDFDILMEVTLSYKAQPRRTRRNRRKYLSTWLDWDCSKRGEDPQRFLARILDKYDAPEDAEKGEGIFKWTLGKQNNHGIIRDVSRSAGTIQKDWTTVKSFELTEAFCIAVVGHEGWNNDPNAEVPYSLVVSFEALGVNIPIYTALVEAQVEIEVEQQVEIQSLGGI
ncbi:S8 family peptidase [Trichocoleus sp. DQ-A3]|uniref:S8 family peptidase n=1 Tax=Cyanophyceae TaxID=3028117 RepID=UPI00168482A7|nr:S8 family peptidase [Coleofasciculus sp. FACHB-125]MBD1898395.1 S8 family peptidase [Coleofasciculus sp. FACHB-125]